MLTVLIKEATGETLVEATSVEWYEGTKLLSLLNGNHGSHFSGGDEAKTRDVFVMNSDGNTVARYLL